MKMIEYAEGAYGIRIPLTETERELVHKYGLTADVIAGPAIPEPGLMSVPAHKEFTLFIRKAIVPPATGLEKEGLIKMFEALKPYFDRVGFQVYNCNPDSHFQVFPYFKYEDAVAEAIGEIPQKLDTLGWYDEEESGRKRPGTRAQPSG